MIRSMTGDDRGMCVSRVFAACAAAMLALGGWAAVPPGAVNIAEFVAADGKTDVADALQRVIDGNPNRTLYFPDGVYLISKPVCTPAHPSRSVDLQMSNYAVIKAAPGWSHSEAMIRLGGIHPANDIRTVGSCYSLTGGVIDGCGVANGVSIDSGRETKVRNVSMKGVHVGLHIKHGANNNSSDCDIADVNIVGDRKPGSTGVFIESCDNTLTNMRIADVQTGVKITRSGGGNLMSNIHPLCTVPGDQYDESVGFADDSWNSVYHICYSDHFSTGFLFGRNANGTVMDACIVYWYSPSKGRRHTAVRCDGRFRAQIANMMIGFNGTEAVNTVLAVGETGGKGYLRDPRLNGRLLRADDLTFREYLQGEIH